MMRKLNAGILAAVFCFFLQGCMTIGAGDSGRILGQWQSNVGGLPIVVKYDETSVRIGSNEAVAYKLEGDQLAFANGGGQVRVVSFPSKNLMVQLDPLTGTRHEYTRAPK